MFAIIISFFFIYLAAFHSNPSSHGLNRWCALYLWKKKKVSIGWGKIIPVFHSDDLLIHCWCQMKVITRTLDKVLSLYNTTYAPTNLYLKNIIFLCSLTKLITIFVKFLLASFHFCVFSLAMWFFQVKLKELLQTGFQPLWML